MKNDLQTAMLFILLFLNAPLWAQTNLEKANKHYDLNAFNLAIKSYQKVLEKQPDNVEALGKLGDCYFFLNDPTEAIKWYEKAAKLPNFNANQLINYAKSLMSNGLYDNSRELMAKYSNVIPEESAHLIESCDFATSHLSQPSAYKIDHLPAVNSVASDFGAVLNENYIVFSSARTDIKRSFSTKSGEDWGRKNPTNQLFISPIGPNGDFAQPEFLHSDLKNTYNEGSITYSRDGKWVAFAKNNYIDGTRQVLSQGVELSLYIVEVTPDGNWKESRAFPHNGLGFSSGFPSLNEDGSLLYFASNRPNGFGGFDIYVSKRTGSDWSIPENLGPVINTVGNEISPFYDGKDIYFSSDWHQGFGGQDVFRAVLENGRWDSVYHLGNAINSPRDDYHFFFDADRNMGFVTSNRVGGSGNEDIYKVTKTTTTLVVQVQDAAQNPIENVTLDFAACDEPTFKTDKDGKYMLQVQSDFSCKVIVKKSGFQSTTSNISPANAVGKTIVITLQKEDASDGKIIDFATRKPLADVVVRATNQANGSKLETTTDADGRYSLTLKPNTTYIVNFSKTAYSNINKTIKTNKPVEKDLLGTLLLRPAELPITVATDAVITDDKPMKTTDENSEITVATAKNYEIRPTLPNMNKLSETYTIQLAALSNVGRSINMEKYRDLEIIDKLYTVTDAKTIRIRLGLFADRHNAENALRKVIAKGFNDAFIVVEKHTPSNSDNSTTKRVMMAPPSAKMVYKVRLGTYKNVHSFDSTPLEKEKLGLVEEVPHGEFTIMLLTGYDSIEEAELVKDRAFYLGYKDAQIVDSALKPRFLQKQ